jgi:hypothetical protein
MPRQPESVKRNPPRPLAHLNYRPDARADLNGFGTGRSQLGRFGQIPHGSSHDGNGAKCRQRHHFETFRSSPTARGYSKAILPILPFSTKPVLIMSALLATPILFCHNLAFDADGKGNKVGGWLTRFVRKICCQTRFPR